MVTRPYTPAQARALHALAESRPDPETYARERARILGRKEDTHARRVDERRR